jgi:hypothetical protein
MFNSGYKFNLVDKKSIDDSELLTIHYYNFRGKRRYIALVEEYIGQIFIVKFYPHSHHSSPDKYNVLVNDYDAARVIKTAIYIMRFLFEQHPEASFGFLAANTITETAAEILFYNKRFQIYSQLMADYFSSNIFVHISSETNSAYLLINRCHTDIDTFTDNALQMFIRNYPDLEATS